MSSSAGGAVVTVSVVDGVDGVDTVGTTGESLWDHSGGGCGNVTGGAPGASLALAHP